MFRRIVEINVLSVLVLCFLLVSCKFTELIFYEHEPSKLFYESYDMDKPELDGFTEDGVLFVIDIRTAMNEEYFLWLDSVVTRFQFRAPYTGCEWTPGRRRYFWHIEWQCLATV